MRQAGRFLIVAGCIVAAAVPRVSHCFTPSLGVSSLFSFHQSFSLRARGGMPNGVKKENLPSKICIVCNRPFNWRKKVHCFSSCSHVCFCPLLLQAFLSETHDTFWRLSLTYRDGIHARSDYLMAKSIFCLP